MLFSLLMFAYSILKSKLNNNGIKYQSIKIEFPLQITINHLTIENQGFNLLIKNASFDLSFLSLAKGEFAGSKLSANELIINTFPTSADTIPSDTSGSFKYSSLPLFQFQNVIVDKVSMQFINESDTNIINSNLIHLNNLVFNDSICADSLLLQGGDFRFIINSLDTLTEALPYSWNTNIPFFNVKYALVDSSNLFVKTGGVPLRLNKINITAPVKYSNKGLNVVPNNLQFLIQDTLLIKAKSESFILENIYGGNVNNLNIIAPGIKLSIAEIITLGGDDASLNYLKFNPSHISTKIIDAITLTDLFDANCNEIKFHGGITYYHDTLSFNKLFLATNTEFSGVINGKITDLKDNINLAIEIKPLMATTNGINSTFNFKLPHSLNNIKTNSSLVVSGNITNPSFKSDININNAPIKISGNLYKNSKQNYIMNYQIKSNYIDFNKILPKLEIDLITQNLNIASQINLNKISHFEDLNLNITADSIKYSNYNFKNPSFNLINKSGVTIFRTFSPSQKWSLLIKTKNDILKPENLEFEGVFDFDMLNLKEQSARTGSIHSGFKGQLTISKALNKLNLFIDTLSFKSFNNDRTYSTKLKTTFRNQNNKYEINIIENNNSFLSMNFNDSLFKFIKSPSINKQILPELNLQASLNLDSTFINDLTAINAAIVVNKMTINSNNKRAEIELEIPSCKYESYRLTNLNLKLLQELSKMSSEASISTLSYNGFYIKNIFNNTLFKNDSTFIYLAGGLSNETTQHLDLHSIVTKKDDIIHVSLNKDKEIHLGKDIWKSNSDKGIQYNLSKKTIDGELGIHNNEQKISFYEEKSTLHLMIDSLKIGPILSTIFNKNNIDAYFNSNSELNLSDFSYNVNGTLTNIKYDSIVIGTVNYSAKGVNSTIKLNLKSENLFGIQNINGKYSNGELQLNGQFSKLYLNKIDTIFHFFGKNNKLTGFLGGNIDLTYGKTNDFNGTISFNNVGLFSGDNGISLFVNNQFLYLNKSTLHFNDFTINDKQSNKLVINGTILPFEDNKTDIHLTSHDFCIIDNNQPKSEIKGKIKIDSKLKLSGKGINYSLEGNLNIINGSNVEYFYKGNTALSGTDNIVIFKNFNAENKDDKSNLFGNKTVQVNYNVNMDIGNTDVYVLLSKTHQEYARLRAHGNLKISEGKGIIPQIYGTISANEGKVYYEAPIVQNIELTIDKAAALWNGPIDNPVISFVGKETFRVTPNEMSAELKNKTDRVPVIVTTSINEKNLKHFDLNFGITSNNSEIQNLINSLPEETKENYAINMLLFGKINRDAEKTSSSLDNVVNKMNEISRRNVKNADLTFYVDKNDKINGSNNETQSNIGYNYSKGFFHRKLKFSIGGNLGLNQTTQTENTKNTLINNIQLKYIIKEKPQLFIQLCRESTYKGPFEGQVDVSSFGIGYDMEHKNLFKKSAK